MSRFDLSGLSREERYIIHMSTPTSNGKIRIEHAPYNVTVFEGTLQECEAYINLKILDRGKIYCQVD